ncbi:MAG: YggS family pyridoxal phosphate-dependent enzyme [Actinomycetaceae bacterium]|nr:YggS family pyridoxal phosphate-dependent enzyme [Actinomycetaceae bacterium]
MVNLQENIEIVREKITEAARAAGRDGGDIALELAVKTQTAKTCRAAALALAAAKLPVLLGHNRVQEAEGTIAAIRDAQVGAKVSLIGPLQSNKINPALRCFDEIETVATARLAHKLAERWGDEDDPLSVLIQVNTSEEPTKSGCARSAAVDLAFEIAELAELRLSGFMTIGAHTSNQQKVRESFEKLRQIRDIVADSGRFGTENATALSMGMSGDMDLAIACGSTRVRVGTAVFGARR